MYYSFSVYGRNFYMATAVKPATTKTIKIGTTKGGDELCTGVEVSADTIYTFEVFKVLTDSDPVTVYIDNIDESELIGNYIN